MVRGKIARIAQNCILGSVTRKNIQHVKIFTAFANHKKNTSSLYSTSSASPAITETKGKPRQTPLMPLTKPTRQKENEHILTLSCPDRKGIVHAVTGFLEANDLTILDSQQYGDSSPASNTFFMRVHFGPADSSTSTKLTSETIGAMFEEVAKPLNMKYDLHAVSQKLRTLILCSKQGHCLNDLLFRQSTSQLPISVPLIVSNHPDFKPLAATYNIPFHHLPVNAENKLEQEARILELITEHKVELVVLARYMQVLSEGFCKAMSGKIINIHHSFLPSFKGAKPYHQAHDRGVKLIGATAHFVTSDLDEGPIIEQNVVRVGHEFGPKELTMEGSVVESNVLASAVKWVAERRVLLNGHRTVVFN